MTPQRAYLWVTNHDAVTQNALCYYTDSQQRRDTRPHTWQCIYHSVQHPSPFWVVFVQLHYDKRVFTHRPVTWLQLQTVSFNYSSVSIIHVPHASSEAKSCWTLKAISLSHMCFCFCPITRKCFIEIGLQSWQEQNEWTLDDSITVFVQLLLERLSPCVFITLFFDTVFSGCIFQNHGQICENVSLFLKFCRYANYERRASVAKTVKPKAKCFQSAFFQKASRCVEVYERLTLLLTWFIT